MRLAAEPPVPTLCIQPTYNCSEGNIVAVNMQGQCCTAGSRTFVHESVYDKFVQKATELARKRVIGDTFDSQTQHGPQVLPVLAFTQKMLFGRCMECASHGENFGMDQGWMKELQKRDLTGLCAWTGVPGAV